MELSLPYTEGDRVDFFRPTMQLSVAQRNAVASWAIGITTTQPQSIYWTSGSFANFAYAYLEWNTAQALLLEGEPVEAALLTAKMNGIFANLDSLKLSTTQFICSTLGWRAYFEGTGHTLDLSTPNNAGYSDPILRANSLQFPNEFLTLLQPHFVFPDTISLSGKVAKF